MLTHKLDMRKMVFFMAKYRKKLEADIRCPLEYGLWWQMEIAYYMRAFRQQKTALQRDTKRNV